MSSRSQSTVSPPKPISHFEHAIQLETSLNELRDTGLLSDVTIVCGSQTFKAHKVILVASSGYFFSIFTKKLKNDIKHLAMTDVSPEILKIILDYIYTGVLNINCLLRIKQDALCKALHHLKMTDIYSHRLHLMIKSLAPNYYSELWSLATIYQMKDMSNEIAKFITQNLEACMNDRYFVHLTLQQLVAILSNEYLKSTSEISTMQAIQKWVLYDIATRERYVTGLLSVAKITTSAKAKAIAFYDSELQSYFAPSRKRSPTPRQRKDSPKKMFRDSARSSQLSVSFKSEKNDKVIRTWKKKPVLKLHDNSTFSLDSIPEAEFQSEDDQEDKSGGDAEKTKDYDSEIAKLQRKLGVVSPTGKSNDLPHGNGDQEFKHSSIDSVAETSGINSLELNYYPQTERLSPSVIATELYKKFKKPVRVHSIQMDQDSSSLLNPKSSNEVELGEEKMQIIKLKNKLNSIINRIRNSLGNGNRGNMTCPVCLSDEDSSIPMIDTARSRVHNIDLEESPVITPTTSAQFLCDVMPSITNINSQEIAPETFIEEPEDQESLEDDFSDQLTFEIREDSDEIDNNPEPETFRVNKTDEDALQLDGISKSPSAKGVKAKPPSGKHGRHGESKHAGVILKRPTATNHESVISPEEVRCRLERFKKLMHTKSSNPVDVEKINLKGSRSYIIQSKDTDATDSSEHSDILSDISEVDSVYESGEECSESQAEWYRTLSTIPEEASISDFTGNSHIELEITSSKSEPPMATSEKPKTCWVIKEIYEGRRKARNSINIDFQNSEKKINTKSETNNCVNNDLNRSTESTTPKRNSGETNSNDIKTATEGRKCWKFPAVLTVCTSGLAEEINDNMEDMANLYSDTFLKNMQSEDKDESIRMEMSPLCNLGSPSESSESEKTYVQDNAKTIETNINEIDNDDFKDVTKLCLKDLKKNKINNVFEYGGYQCFAEKVNPEETETITARSSDTLNITLQNLVTTTHNKLKQAPAVNDNWKMWKSKLETSCKPSPRASAFNLVNEAKPTTSNYMPMQSANLSLKLEKLEEAEEEEAEEEDDEELNILGNSLRYRSSTIDLVKSTSPRENLASPLSSLPPISLPPGVLSYFEKAEINPTKQVCSAPSKLDYKDMTSSEQSVPNIPVITRLKNFQLQNEVKEKPLNIAPVSENEVISLNISLGTETTTTDTFTSNNVPKYVTCVNNDPEPLIILLAINKKNEPSQQVYSLRRHCWLPPRRLLMPPPEWNYSVGYFEGNVYYIGGLANGSFAKTNNVLVYRSPEHALVSAADMLVARVGGGVANMNNYLYVAGGIGRYHKPIAQVERYDSKLDRWHLVSALRIARTNICLVTCGKLLFAIGGTVSADSIQEVVSKACESYDSEIDQWSLLVDLPSHFLMTNPLVTSICNKLYAVRIAKPDMVFRFHTRKNKWLPIQNTKLNVSKVCCVLPGEWKMYAIELAGKTIHAFDMHAFQWEVETHFPSGIQWQAAAFVTGLD